MRNDTCPNCRTINKDGWSICAFCHEQAPVRKPPVRQSKRAFHKDGELTEPDLEHVLWCMKKVPFYDPSIAPDLFWRRHLGIVRMFKRMHNERVLIRKQRLQARYTKRNDQQRGDEA